MGTRCCAVKELYQVSRLAAFRQHLEECLEYPGATEPPEPLPHAVPFAIVAREGSPRYAVHSEVVDGFQELTVITPRLSRLDCAALNTSSTVNQSRSVITVSMSGSLMPITQ